MKTLLECDKESGTRFSFDRTEVPENKFRCDECGEYFDEDEGEWVDNLGELKIFYCNRDLKRFKREEMKTRVGIIPTFPGERP